jgi:AbrB family looped-hinge helix DNA binding protein
VVVYRTSVDAQGRLVIPSDLRSAAGIAPGSEVAIEVYDDEIRVRSLDAAITRVQKKYRRLSCGRQVVDEFSAERRYDAKRE